MERIKKQLDRERTIGKVMIAMILVLVMGIVAGTGINKVRKDFHDAYTDHIIPTLDIFHALERQYQNRYFLDELITGTGRSKTELAGQIARNNKIIDSIASHYITSHRLEPKEQQDFKDYVDAAAQYRELEKRLIRLCADNKCDSAKHLYQSTSAPLFKEAVKHIDQLEDDQIAYVTSIYKDAEEMASTVSTVIFVTGFIGLLYALSLVIRYARQSIAS